LPRHPTHLIIEGRPAFTLALKAEDYKIANYRVDCLHTGFLRKIALLTSNYMTNLNRLTSPLRAAGITFLAPIILKN
jgi:hypothetical protein